MGKTEIEWSTDVWNPVTGCKKVSAGCKHCYAERIAERFWGARLFTEVRCHEDRLDIPLRWRKPRTIFVNSMSDLFHEDVPNDFIHRVFGVMALCRRHVFQVLTKRPERMRRYFETVATRHMWAAAAAEFSRDVGRYGCDIGVCNGHYPLPNVWLGVSVEDQKTADERIPHLLDVPAAVRFLSVEPMLGPIDLRGHDLRGPLERAHLEPHRTRPVDLIVSDIGWVICGGESGPGARPMDEDWVRDIRDQCVSARVPFFFKQWGGVNKRETGRILDGRTWDEMPGGPS